MQSESRTTPNPGSEAAIAQGCICPILDNGRGKGRGDGNFWITEGCPLHFVGKEIVDARAN